MITWPSGVSWGSTTALNDVIPIKVRSRCAELIGRRLPLESTLFKLSYRFQVAPPSCEIRKPTPGVPVSPSPVAAMMSDWLGSWFRPKTVILPMLMALVGPKSVSGIQTGPEGLVVRKLVVSQTPPLAPAAKTVLPDGSAGSMASPVTRPEPPKSDTSPPEPLEEPIAADPTAVHA